MAKVLGISKSSVQRHLTSQLRRQQYPESHFWETTEGQNWLRLLVFGAIYCFGIKGGVGADRLSTFFVVVAPRATDRVLSECSENNGSTA
jgi:hypothetical protein